MDIKEKKKAVIKKFYGGKRLSYYHNFDENTGICKECRKFIGNVKLRICTVITKDEVANFSEWPDY